MLSIPSRSSVRATLFVAATVASAFAAACGGSSEPKVPPKDVVPATITSTVTTPLTGVGGTQLNTPLSVRVVNKAGEPIDSALVTFAVTSGGGAVSNTAVRTVAGLATTTWTLGSGVGTQTVTATVGTLAPVTFTATATAGAAKNLTKNSTDPQTAVAGNAVAAAPSVKVTDANNNPVANVLVTFSVASGGGSVTAPLANTDANGVATAGSWKLGSAAGINTLTATAAGITGTVTFSATGTVGAATQIAITNTAPTLSAGQTFAFTTQVRDAGGNVISNAPITWSSSNNAVATVSSTGVVTGVSGGTSTITATTGSVSAQQTVNVLGHVPTGSTISTVAMTSSIGGLSIVEGTAYVARSTANAVGIVDLQTSTLTTSVDVLSRAIDVAAAPGVIAAATSNPALVWFINSAGVRTDSIELPANPVKMAITSNGTKLFVDMNNFNVAVIDVPSRTITSLVSVGGTPVSMRMGTGDTVVYVATVFGAIHEIVTATGTIRKTTNTNLNITANGDVAIAPDGRTAFIADGTNTITVLRLAAGGMSDANLTFAGPVTALSVTPDGKQLWAGYSGANSAIGIAPIVGTDFDIISAIPIAGLNPKMIRFNRLGSIGVVVDASVNQLVILK